METLTPQQALDLVIPCLWAGFVLALFLLIVENRKAIQDYLNFVPVQLPKDDDDGDPPSLQ